MIGMEFDSSALFAKLDALNDHVQGNVIRAGTQAATQAIYDEVAMNAARMKSAKGHWFHGTSFKLNGTKYWFDAGTLADSIYQVFSKDNSGKGFVTYHVAWNHKKCPYGHMVEYGTRGKQGHSFLRKGYEATKAKAMSAAKRKIAEMLNVS